VPPFPLIAKRIAQPGYYEDGAFGIRIESVLVAKRADFDRTFGNVEYVPTNGAAVCVLD
jgi:Xaa-Pro aminopeptidase